MRSPAREGLDRLLAEYPGAELAWAVHQDRAVLATRRWQQPRTAEQLVESALSSSSRPSHWEGDGPWLCVDLYEGTKLDRFAIWIRTGNVFRLDDHGAVEDDPFITVTP